MPELRSEACCSSRERHTISPPSNSIIYSSQSSQWDLPHLCALCTTLYTEHGFIGYSPWLLSSNTMPDYTSGESFFTVFGVFFPAATGVMAGFNMSSDLQRPEHNIPVGTLAAVFTSWFLYLVFVFLLGAICTREALRYDFLIAEKVSLVGFLFLLGLYISSLASCMGGLYAAPRILQCIAQERVIPALAFLGRGLQNKRRKGGGQGPAPLCALEARQAHSSAPSTKGPNRTPVAGICLTSLLTMAFIFIGQVNVLAPIVSINFMLTYSFIDYSYFSVAMTCQLQSKEKRDTIAPAKRYRRGSTRQSSRPLIEESLPSYGSGGESPQRMKGTLLEFTKDMDQIFPPVSNVDAEAEKTSSMQELSSRCKGRKAQVTPKQMLMDSFGLDLNRNMFPEENVQEMSSAPREEAGEDPQESAGDPPHHSPVAGGKAEQQSVEIKPMQDSLYAKFCNHWVALIGAMSSILIMFVIQWAYALANIVLALLLFFYIGKVSPGLPIGIAARFSFFVWLKSSLKSICRGKGSPPDEIVVTPALSGVGLKTKQLTEENADFASRHRYHQSSFIRTETMVQPPAH
ncbi:Solute carrier family 12 member 8 [Dissostichus eleginoides]|uniref:Solute carrier family 12 member 8 n=1 Tax=Dissostichus eleginoides TaxID=100907 RepID=A0AAD9CHZ0_DISEL|nr:Solute carrier family 12 member 8 [Dissostichus eleginoides]